MNLEEAKIYWREHENRKCICEPHNPNTFCYKSIGFIEGYKQCLDRMSALVEALEYYRELDCGKNPRNLPDFAVIPFASCALKHFELIKREVEGK